MLNDKDHNVLAGRLVAVKQGAPCRIGRSPSLKLVGACNRRSWETYTHSHSSTNKKLTCSPLHRDTSPHTERDPQKQTGGVKSTQYTNQTMTG